MNRATVLTDRFDRARLYATHVHGGQVRKGTSTPYIAHLLAVAATVLEYGGDEDVRRATLRILYSSPHRCFVGLKFVRRIRFRCSGAVSCCPDRVKPDSALRYLRQATASKLRCDRAISAAILRDQFQSRGRGRRCTSAVVQVRGGSVGTELG
jgi:hypothetical protein